MGLCVHPVSVWKTSEAPMFTFISDNPTIDVTIKIKASRCDRLTSLL